MSWRVPEPYRLTSGDRFATTPGLSYGAFQVVNVGRPEYPLLAQAPEQALRPGTNIRLLRILASDGAPGTDDDPTPVEALGWEHVSVSVARKGTRHDPTLPTWPELCAIKALFWEPEDVVVQFHPRASEYVDFAPVLHLWRHDSTLIPTPPHVLVGPR